jgi:hypothetical protein
VAVAAVKAVEVEMRVRRTAAEGVLVGRLARSQREVERD